MPSCLGAWQTQCCGHILKIKLLATWCGPCCAQAGVGAILVGESLVKQGDPAAGVKTLLSLP